MCGLLTRYEDTGEERLDVESEAKCERWIDMMTSWDINASNG